VAIIDRLSFALSIGKAAALLCFIEGQFSLLTVVWGGTGHSESAVFDKNRSQACCTMAASDEKT